MVRALMAVIICSFIGIAIYLPWHFESHSPIIKYSDFINAVKKGNISEVAISNGELRIKDVNGETYYTFSPDVSNLIQLLLEQKVAIQTESNKPGFFFYLLIGIIITSVIGLFALWVLNRYLKKKEGNEFAKTKVINLCESMKCVTFNDVEGIDEAKEEVKEIVDFLKDPSSVNRLGGRMPKGVLLMGPPGTGKTLLARAIAGEAGTPFFSISGSDFVEMFVGVGASRVRELFREAKKNAPCIIFIDEIDAVGKNRGVGDIPGGQDERQQTLNALLVEMDGFESDDNIVVIAATNRPDVLDPALLRPGRFDRRIYVPPPDMKGRYAILKVHARNVILAKDVDLKMIAKGTPGFTGADIRNLVNEAALEAARKGKSFIEMEDFEEAKDKIVLGIERRGVVMDEEDRRIIAYHEVGHAIMAKMLPGADPVHKITIIPRGRSMGVTQQLPIDEHHVYSMEYLMNRIKILFGGRAAEEIVFGRQTTAVRDDLAKATAIATMMICQYGMSNKIGPISYQHESSSFLTGVERPLFLSEEMAALADKEINRLLKECYEATKAIIIKERALLNKVAEILLVQETLDGEEFDIIYECNRKLSGDDAALPDKCSVCNITWCEKKLAKLGLDNADNQLDPNNFESSSEATAHSSPNGR
ncbi:ATP-dependent zinc metalloprotease FtsH [Dissulfurimicrobium hydrothermale]|uniref:ATP-dependent zinc metalloprotease FtsH n=2 Tax=Dissulfurimicrobium hydrothermale TaxID=1750598 RepID=UPI001EDB5B33|nr:ATP-dependent zinc metalloprotease FtsH [Dissulfurimicrobium hydrothermale]UKL14633.1 ATP-dependent zinc metalloprotease FtsH [Dissulfurimicrobium hydrothermale]